MTDERMVCKHCGGKDFYAEVTVTGYIDVVVTMGDDGRPSYEEDGYVRDMDTHDHDVEDWHCNACGKSSFRLAELVVAAPPSDTPIAPCVRCEHGRTEHPELGWNPAATPHYTRGPMPCDHEGCDCHDYFDPNVVPAEVAA